MRQCPNIFDKPEAGLGAGFSGSKHAQDVGVIAGQWILRSGDHQCHPRADAIAAPIVSCSDKWTTIGTKWKSSQGVNIAKV
jgi:hypothetical protein